MPASASADRAAWLAELRLDEAPHLVAALDALLRSVCRQTGAQGAALVLDNGSRRWVASATEGAWPAAPDASSPVQIGELGIGCVQLWSPSGPCDMALADAARVASALLDARLHERVLTSILERERMASAAGSDWLWETDAEGFVTWVSDSAERHTGWPVSREIGAHASRFVRPPPGPEELASWNRYRADREAHRPFREAICERDTAHGTMLAAMSGQPRFDQSGRFQGYRGAARDVTAEVAQRHAARQAHQQLMQAMDAVHAALMISGPDGRVQASNAAWKSLLNTMVASGLYPDAAGREEEFVRWRLSLASPDAPTQELSFGDRTVLVSDKRLPDGSTVHLSIDVTEQRRAEQGRRETEARLSAVLRAVPDLWFVVDRDDRLLMCSDEHHPLLIAPFEQQRGQRLGAVLTPPYDTMAQAALTMARGTGETQRFEYESVTLDGRRHHFEARLAPMPDNQVLYLTRDLTDLRQLERELMVLQRAIETDSSVPIIVTDATRDDEPIAYVNPAFERLTGYPREEALGRNCRFLQGADRNQPALAALREALAGEQPCTVVLSNRRRDGSEFLNELSVVPIRDAQGRVMQHLGVLKDVTERVRAAERLRVSEDLYRSVAATISDGLLVVGPDGRIVACNPSACEMLACSPERLSGRRLSELGYRIHTEADLPFTEAEHPVRQVLLGGPPVRDRALQLHRPDGSTRTMMLTARALSGAGSPAASCLVSFRDVTDQRVAARALAVAEERWKFALEGAGDGVWDYDEDTRRIFYSKSWKEMLGHAESEIGPSLSEWSDRIHPDDRAAVLAAIAEYRSGRRSSYQTEHRLRHRDGHWIWVLDRGKIVERHADGRPRRVVGIHTDITRLKQAEQALMDKQAAELASRAKSEFLSRMSHEMRTPLNAVIGFTQLLKLQPDGGPAKVAEYADHVLRASEHLLGLVNEVLDLQRVEEGRTEMQPQALELAPFLDSTLDLMRPAALREGIALTNQVPAGRWVHADARSLRQVLMNMVSNAVKYNRNGGWVVISLLPAPPGRCVIAIEDTGSGLSDEQLSRLFQPFERLGHETSAIEGSGLGLVITRSLIELMGGTVTLSSVPGAGTLARIDLPAADPPASAPPSPANVPPVIEEQRPMDQPALRVLYVEDNRINALLFEEAMRVLGGIELLVAENGADALRTVEAWTPQVLVLDANLPDMNGNELLVRLRRRPELAGVPAYMCSADAMPEDLQRARDSGFQGYWTKPIELNMVSAALDAQRPAAPA
ncbi:PAS domain S-box protein [Rhizobacter sp. AJA081-3]|uniref:PAS domain S-box protein n=1 Tax=Rhizobacter sp. AJA081-3 TaxID=2753607 RepID=UPI001AE09A2F|nr:PAS domain S-box protein [Rhizobacter sp. AJA081-3]QTN25307.1 PAS domain S-box protein [Rhizobacter sp. AJA081-3]